MATTAATLEAIIKVTGADKAARDLTAFGAKVDKAGQSGQKASSGVTALGKSAEDAGSQAGRAAGQISKAGESAAKAGDSAAKASSGFNKLAAEAAKGAAIGAGWAAANTVMAGVSAGIGFVADSAIGMNARLEQADIAFTTMLGSAEKAGTFLQQLSDFAAQTPFEFPELVTASQRLLAMGFAAGDILPLMEDIGNVSAGLGAGTEGIDRMVTSLGQMQSKTRVQTEELLQLQELGVPALQILADAMGVTVAESQKMVTAGQVSSDVFIQAFQDASEADFGGMMEAQSKTFTGAMSTITDSLQMGIATGLRPFFEMASDGAVELATYLSGDEFDAFATGVAEDMSTAANAVRDFVGDNREELLGFASDMATAVQSTGEMVIGIQTVIERVDEVTGVFEQLTGTIGLVPKVVNIAVNLTEGTGSDAVVPEEIVANGVTVPVNIDDKSVGGGDGLLDTLMDTGKSQFVYTNTKMIIDGITWLDDIVQQANNTMSTEQVMALAEAYETAYSPLYRLDQELMQGLEYNHERAMAWEAEKAAMNEAVTSMLEVEHVQAMSNASTQGSIAISEQQLAIMADLNSGNDAYAGSISSVAQAIDEEATIALLNYQETLAGLSGAYQENLGQMAEFSGQASEYTSAQSAIEKSYDRIAEKVQNNIDLTAEEQLIWDEGPDVMARYAGGIEDAEDQQALYAIAAGKVVEAQDELDKAIKNNVDDLGPYQQALKDAEGFLGDVESATGGTASAQATLADIIQGDLIGSIADLTRALEYVAKPWLIEVDAATAAAESEIARIKGIIEEGATLPISLWIGDNPLTGQNYSASGGDFPSGGWSWVGEEGKELMHVPPGAEIYNHHTSMEMADRIPGFAQGTNMGAINAATGSNKGYINAASMDVSGFEEVGLAIGEQILSGIITAFGPDALAELMPAADAIADAMITGAVVKIESEIEGIPDTFAVNAERIPELAAGIGQDTAMALMESYAELQGELQLAILSGEDTSQIDAELAAILALFEAWGISVIGTATSVGEAMQAVADADAFENMFTDVLGDLDGVASGERADALKEEFNDLWAQLKIAQEKGMTDVVADLDAQMQAIEDELAVIGEVAGTAVGQGMIEGFDAEQIAAEWAERLGDAVSGPSFGSGLQADIDALQSQIDLGILTGAPSAVIAEWQKEKADLIAQSEQYWRDIATAGANGLLSEEQMAAYAEAGGEQFMAILEGMVGEDAAAAMTDGVTQMTDEAFNTMLGIFQEGDVGEQMVQSVIDGFLSGVIPMEEAMALLAEIPEEELYPILAEMGYESWEAFQTAMLEGSDPTQFERNMQMIIDVLVATGMTVAEATALVEGFGAAVDDVGKNLSSSGFGWLSGPSGPVLPSGSGGSSLSSRSGGGSSSGGGGSANFSSGDDDVSALMKKYPNLDWAGILAGEYGKGGLNAESPTEAWVAAGLANPKVDVGTYSALRAFQVLLDKGLDIANNATLFDRFEIAVKLVTENAELLQDSLFMGALGIIGISEEAIRAAQTATKLSKNERSTVSEPIRVNDEGDVFIGVSDRWADDLGFVGGNTKEGSGTRIPAFGNGSVIDHPLLALLGDKGPELAQPLAAGHPERARFIDDIADTVIQRMGGGPPTFVIDGQVFAGVTSKRVMHGVAAKAGS